MSDQNRCWGWRFSSAGDEEVGGLHARLREQSSKKGVSADPAASIRVGTQRIPSECPQP
jgi:hypothetical protein